MGVFFWCGAMIEFHAITPQGRQLVAQLVDGKLVIPPESPPQPVPVLPNQA